MAYIMFVGGMAPVHSCQAAAARLARHYVEDLREFGRLLLQLAAISAVNGVLAVFVAVASGTGVPHDHVPAGVRQVLVGFRVAYGGCGSVLRGVGARCGPCSRAEVSRSASMSPSRRIGHLGFMRTARAPLRLTGSGMGIPSGCGDLVAGFALVVTLALRPEGVELTVVGGDSPLL